MCSRYYFNLTDGNQIIRDDEGLQLADINAAVGYAIKAIEELRAEARAPSEEWLGWRMEITNGTGEMVWVIPLEPWPLKTCSWH
ncbi:DUF6894 family protein [Microvirga sp. G4-2]|uniref:DUF6894 family protein n=1 Tax=Microvirga sp. G4-2 TaxID=3434467 RepID=UPI004043D3CD